VKVIGLTGGIGSGKSTVARFLAELGAVTLDLDRVGHDILKQADVRDRLVETFGRGILDARGGISRSKLGRLVFNDPAALERLNAVSHPAIDRLVADRLEEYRRQGARVVVLEAAAILEAGRTQGFDEIWVTIAPEASMLRRVRQRGGLSQKQAAARLHSQLTNEEKVRQADVVIENDGSLDELWERVAAVWRRLQERL
jgi:dephospho-CoA kinase